MKPSILRALPDFLQVCVRKGIIDERAARRIELHRRSRGLGRYEIHSAVLHDPPDAGLTFESFVVTKGNNFAVEVAKRVAFESPDRLPYNPLYIYGDVGLGKTHLLSAISNAASNKHVILVNTADLEAELELAKSENASAKLRQWLTSAEILMVDDVQLCERNEDLQRTIFAVLNHMIKDHRWVVITSDAPPTRLEGVEHRLLSRLGGGVIVGLQLGDREERRTIVKSFINNPEASEEVIDYLADLGGSNIRQLKAAIAQLITQCEQTQKGPTLDMAKRVVGKPGFIDEIVIPENDGSSSKKTETTAQKDARSAGARKFKEMLARARNEEELVVALREAIDERLRQLREGAGDVRELRRLTDARDHLQAGRVQEAIRCFSR